MDPLVSVVIVTRDRAALLAEALDAVGRQSWASREVIVVDNGHCRRTRTVAQEHAARYVSAPDVTLATARQAGVEEARGEIVAFTDDDCLPHPGWLDAIVSAFRRRPTLTGVQGRTEAGAGPVGSHAVRVSGPDRLYRTCNIAYRRDALQRAGGFDLDFQGWFEDTALAARVLEHGAIGFEPGAAVTHRAMPRRPLDRERWQTLLEDERRLALHYPTFYRRTRGRWFLSTVFVRWLVGSPLKTLLRELPSGRDDPRAYLDLIRLLLRERAALLAALVTTPSAGRTRRPPRRSTRG